MKLRIPAGRATAGPPVGSTLGQWGLNMMDFINPFNDATKDRMGMVLPTIINIYEDRSFDFITKQPPMTYLIKTELNLKSGSKLPHKDKVAHITFDQLKTIATQKIENMNAVDIA